MMIMKLLMMRMRMMMMMMINNTILIHNYNGKSNVKPNRLPEMVCY